MTTVKTSRWCLVKNGVVCFVYFYWLLCFGFYCCFCFFFKPFLSFFFIENFIMMEQFLFFLFSSKTYVLLFTYAWKKVRLFKKKKNFFWWVDFIISLEQSSVIYLFLIYQVFFLFFFFWQISQVWEKKRKANKTKTFPIFLQNLKMSWDCINYWKFVYIFNA